MAQKWKNQMEPLIESLEHLDDIRLRIKDAESAILAFTNRTKESNATEHDEEVALIRLLEEVQSLIEIVELKTNQLDMKLSAIERLLQE